MTNINHQRITITTAALLAGAALIIPNSSASAGSPHPQRVPCDVIGNAPECSDPESGGSGRAPAIIDVGPAIWEHNYDLMLANMQLAGHVDGSPVIWEHNYDLMVTNMEAAGHIVTPADRPTDWVDAIGEGCRRVPSPQIAVCP